MYPWNECMGQPAAAGMSAAAASSCASRITMGTALCAVSNFLCLTLLGRSIGEVVLDVLSAAVVLLGVGKTAKFLGKAFRRF